MLLMATSALVDDLIDIAISAPDDKEKEKKSGRSRSKKSRKKLASKKGEKSKEMDCVMHGVCI